MNLLLNAAILNLWVGAHRGASEHHLVDLGVVQVKKSV